MKNLNYHLPRIFGVLFFFTSFAYAQKWKLGAKGGISISSLSEKDNNIFADGFESKTDFEAGVFVEYLIKNKWSLQAELLYTTRGGKRNGLQPIPPGDIPIQLSTVLPEGVIPYANFNNESSPNYLEIPILLKHTWGKNWKFYINAGPYIGFLVSAEQKTRGNSAIFLDASGNIPLQIPLPTGPVAIQSSFDRDVDIEDRLEKINFGIHAGIGVIKKVSDKSEISLDVRGSRGFTPIQKDSFLGETTIGGLVFSIGYAFTL